MLRERDFRGTKGKSQYMNVAPPTSLRQETDGFRNAALQLWGWMRGNADCWFLPVKYLLSLKVLDKRNDRLSNFITTADFPSNSKESSANNSVSAELVCLLSCGTQASTDEKESTLFPV